jgi:hypothetical protein
MELLKGRYMTFSRLMTWAFVTGMLVDMAAATENVLTHHYDLFRTGWNSKETILNPSVLTPDKFGLLKRVELDDENDQIDAQPLIVADQPIEGQGTHTVVYVATENNAVYAFDAYSGARLAKATLGPAVPLPLGCNNNAKTVGINSTPVIDLASRALYVISYTLIDQKPTYRLHALDLATLKDKPGDEPGSGSPQIISANGRLANGSIVNFDASVQRQRAALLLANGNIYAGFAAFCDYQAHRSRGWVLAWDMKTLKPAGNPQLLNKAVSADDFDCYFNSPDTQNHPCFLTSVWMSGAGIAADNSGDIYYVTGNSSPSIYEPHDSNNLAESIIRASPDLRIKDFFTPSNVYALNRDDEDFSSGGILLLPDQGAGRSAHLATAAGKDGRMYLVTRDKLSSRPSGADDPPYVNIGRCWCTPAYLRDSDNVERIVSSGGLQLRTWVVNRSTPSGALTLESTSQPLDPLPLDQQTNPDTWPGFFTSISSNGFDINSAVIWAISRSPAITLHAFEARSSAGILRHLWSQQAGTWPNTGGNANLVPVIANGYVYVASYKQLSIFGLQPEKTAAEFNAIVSFNLDKAQTADTLAQVTGPVYWGTVKSMQGNKIGFELRDGRRINIDLSAIVPRATSEFGAIGTGLSVSGHFDQNGALVADRVTRAPNPSLWGKDREY